MTQFNNLLFINQFILANSFDRSITLTDPINYRLIKLSLSLQINFVVPVKLNWYIN